LCGTIYGKHTFYPLSKSYDDNPVLEEEHGNWLIKILTRANPNPRAKDKIYVSDLHHSCW